MQLPNVLKPLWSRIAPASREGEKRAREIEEIGPAQRWQEVQQDEIKYWEKLLGSDQAQRAPRMNFKWGRSQNAPEFLLATACAALCTDKPGQPR